METKYMNLGQVSSLLGISRQTVVNGVRSGHLKGVQICGCMRFNPQDLFGTLATDFSPKPHKNRKQKSKKESPENSETMEKTEELAGIVNEGKL